MTTTTTPIRDVSRNVSAESSERTCLVCTRPPASARARYCSPACRQRLFRLRHVRWTVPLMIGDCAPHCVDVVHSWRTPCTSAANAANAWLVNGAARTAISTLEPSAWAAAALSANSP